MHRHPGISSALAALALLLQGEVTLAADPNPIETVTVEARRRLDREVDHYVSAVVVRYLHDSLLRWNTRVCPLVAGLSRERAEFALQRISQNADAARAPLDGEHCVPNFFVVATAEPDLLLKKWWRRDLPMFNTKNGMGSINRFLQSQRPIRAWYNATFVSSDGAPLAANSFDSGLYGSGLTAFTHAPTNTRPDDTRLRHTSVQSLSSVIIVVDTTRVEDMNMGQLADYVSMVGLAEIHPDADLGDTPSILTLFRAPREEAPRQPPQGLSSWDRAFLYSLYNTSQTSVMQSSLIRTGMLQQIAPR